MFYKTRVYRTHVYKFLRHLLKTDFLFVLFIS